MVPSLLSWEKFFLYEELSNVLLILFCVMKFFALLSPLGIPLKLITDSVKFWNTGKKDIMCVSVAL